MKASVSLITSIIALSRDKIACVTTFGAKQLAMGQQMLDSFYKCWPSDIPIHVYAPIALSTESTERIKLHSLKLHSLEDDIDYLEFIHKFDPRNGKRVYGSKIYEKDPNVAIKFCHKVFAAADYPQVLNDRQGEVDWWIWIDADVVWRKQIDARFLEVVCNPSFLCSYLGRQNWHHSECGFVSYNISSGSNKILDYMKFFYMSGLIFGLPEWHDSYVFDVVRNGIAASGYQCNDLSKDVQQSCSDINVWPKTILGEYAIHNKGPLAKIEAYGEIL